MYSRLVRCRLLPLGLAALVSSQTCLLLVFRSDCRCTLEKHAKSEKPANYGELSGIVLVDQKLAAIGPHVLKVPLAQADKRS